jgi:hypothetical protein
LLPIYKYLQISPNTSIKVPNTSLQNTSIKVPNTSISAYKQGKIHSKQAAKHIPLINRIISKVLHVLFHASLPLLHKTNITRTEAVIAAANITPIDTVRVCVVPQIAAEKSFKAAT